MCVNAFVTGFTLQYSSVRSALVVLSLTVFYITGQKIKDLVHVVTDCTLRHSSTRSDLVCKVADYSITQAMRLEV